MKSSIAGLKPVHLDRDDIKKFNFLPPTTVTQGTPNVSKLHFPVVGFKAIFEQLSGPIANSGTLQGLLEESNDDSAYTTVNLTPLPQSPLTSGAACALDVVAAASNVQQRKVLITKPYVRYTATVSVSTGTVITAASLIC